MKVTRVHSDGAGGSRMDEIEVGGGARAPIPTLEMMVASPKPGRQDFHPPPFRALITPLRGEVEISATSGQSQRFKVGEWVMVDDVETPGHTTECFGDAQLIRCRVPDDWMPPET